MTSFSLCCDCCMQLRRSVVVWQFQSNVSNVPAGVFKGDLVVSMRPYSPDDALKVRALPCCSN